MSSFDLFYGPFYLSQISERGLWWGGAQGIIPLVIWHVEFCVIHTFFFSLILDTFQALNYFCCLKKKKSQTQTKVFLRERKSLKYSCVSLQSRSLKITIEKLKIFSPGWDPLASSCMMFWLSFQLSFMPVSTIISDIQSSEEKDE